MNATALCFTSAVELAQLIRRRALSPVEITRAVLDRIERLNGRLGAYVLVHAERALDEARRREQSVMAGETLGALHGVPISLKDNLWTAGDRTTSGSRLLAEFVPQEDTPSVAALRAAGAIIVGRTNLPEFAWRGSTDNPLFGESRNPWDLTRTPGGSTGGGAAAVAAGLGPLALGSDGAGSIRIPASFCGLVGLKPTFGRVPMYPAAGGNELVAHVCPLARTVRDAALMMNVIARYDRRDPFALPDDGVDYLTACDEPLVGTARGAITLRVAWSADLGFAPVEPETREIAASAARAFEEIGAKVEEISPDLGDPSWILRTLYGGAQAGAHAARPPDQKAQMDPELVAYAEGASSLTVAEYLKAVTARQAMVDALRRFFERYDLLLTPTLCLPAFPLGLVGPREVAGREVTHLGWTLSVTRSTTADSRPSPFPPAGRRAACPSEFRSSDGVSRMRWCSAPRPRSRWCVRGPRAGRTWPRLSIERPRDRVSATWEVAMRVLMSIGGPTVFETDSRPDEILIGTAKGVVWLRQAGPGEPWREAHRALADKHISNLVEDPESGRLFAGTHGDGIHASDDGGRTWQRKDRGVAYANIYSMSAVRAEESVRVYAGTEPAHLFVSQDRGETWRELPTLRSAPTVDTWMFPAPPHVAHVKHITFDPRSADTIYASIEVGGCLKSTDGGQSWRQLSGFFEDVHRMVVTAARPDDVFMGNGIGIYHSADAGETWEQLTDRSARIAYPDAVIVHPHHPDTVFIAGAICGPGDWRRTKTADARVARSRDGGKHWEYLEGGLPAHIHGNIEGFTLNVWPGGSALYAGTTDGDVFASVDEGDTWSTIAERIGAVSKGGHHLALPIDDALVGADAHGG